MTKKYRDCHGNFMTATCGDAKPLRECGVVPTVNGRGNITLVIRGVLDDLYLEVDAILARDIINSLESGLSLLGKEPR